MRLSIVGLTVVALAVASAAASAAGPRRRLGLGEPRVDPSAALPPDQWFDQKLDHFDPTNLKSWKQRYFTNSTWFRQSKSSPVFLMIGGEGEASAKWMVSGAWLDYAEKYSALCFQLEHRFYGKSRPTKDLSVASLRYLSSEQALADLAYFIEMMNAKWNLGKGNKWVLFGGSYPGSLAAWARAKYPHLVHASVSASGPLLAKADFPEYFDTVSASLDYFKPKCSGFLRKAIMQVSNLLTTEDGAKKLSQKFNLCDTIDYKNWLDVATVVEGLSEAFADVVQYNKDNRFTKSALSDVTVDDICVKMLDYSLGDPIQRLVEVNNMKLTLQNSTCQDSSYKKQIKELRNETWESPAADGGRQWTYQTCTEFGFYQTSSGLKGADLFGDKIPLPYFIKQCEDIYGPNFNAGLLQGGIERSNIIYGGLGIAASRVVFVHGTIDPWHRLGITTSMHKYAPAILIEGTAHCADMYPASPKDPPQLKQAREDITNLIGKWLMRD